MQKLHSPEQVGSGQRWQLGAGLWGSLDEQSKLLCAAKNLCCACLVSPMDAGVLFWIGATWAVLASFLSKLWSHDAITALGCESHTGSSTLCPQWCSWGDALVVITVWVLTTAWAPAHCGVCHGGAWWSVLRVIYLFAEAPSGEGHPARMHFRGCHWQPQAACTSSESVELHAAKTRLGMGTPGQQSARKCPDHGQAVSPWLLDRG